MSAAGNAPILKRSASVTRTVRGTARKHSSYGRKQRRREPESLQTAGTEGKSARGEDSAGQQPVVQKQKICVDTLTGGFVQSFVDFFYLMHRPDPNPDPNKPEAADAEIDVSVDAMNFIKDRLTTAEAARRQGETPVVYENYNQLAEHFQSNDDAKTGIYFHEKCLEIARLTSDVAGEMRANHHLGLAYQRLNNLDMAIRLHETHRDLVVKLQEAIASGAPVGPRVGEGDVQAEMLLCCTELVKMYRMKAEKFETERNMSDAIGFYELCLQAATSTGDALMIGQANYRLGRVHIVANMPDKALPYLEIYQEVCRETDNLVGLGDAFSALAAAQQQLNDSAQAIGSLQEYLKISKQTENLSAQAEACCNLGVIHNRRQEFDKAVHFFERNFEISRSIVASGKGTRRLIDNARVNLGMARGNAQIGSYMHVISYDISSLLLWKNRRLDFGHVGKGRRK